MFSFCSSFITTLRLLLLPGFLLSLAFRFPVFLLPHAPPSGSFFIPTLRLLLLPDYLSTFSISLFSLLSYLWRFPPAHFLSQLSGWLLCPISFSTFHLLFSALHLLIFYANHWFGYTVSLVSLVPSLPLLLSTGSLFIPTLGLVVVSVSVLSCDRFKSRLYFITVNKKVNKNLPWVVEKQCFALACGVLAAGMAEKKVQKRCKLSLKKKGMMII